MSKFIKLSELKEQKLKADEMKKVKGGFWWFLIAYGVIATTLPLPK